MEKQVEVVKELTDLVLRKYEIYGLSPSLSSFESIDLGHIANEMNNERKTVISNSMTL